MSPSSGLLHNGIHNYEMTMQITPFAPSSREYWVLNIACSLFVHTIYRRFEPQPINYQATLLLLVLIPAIPAYGLVSTASAGGTICSSVFMLSPSYSFFYTILAISIVVYRVSPFHPLASFPGPSLSRVSQLWPALVCSQGKRHEYFKALHDKYGPYVRVGPNELSCTDVSAIPVILGAMGLPKGPIWESRQFPRLKPLIIGIRDFDEHRRRRKLWNNGLNTAAIKGYEGSLEKRVKQLVSELSKKAGNRIEGQLPTNGETIHLATWFSHFAFDFMGDMVFGGGFELMSRGDVEGIWGFLKSGLRELAILQYFPYFMPLLWRQPSATSEIRKVETFSEKCVRERIDKGSSTRDLFHYLSNESGHESETPPFEQIASDASVAIVAGSDTTSSTLANIFFHIISDPEVYARLRNEIDEAFPPGEPEQSFVDSAKLADLPYLNGVVNEGLRLYPPVPVNIQRQTLNEGRWVGSLYIPPGTAINLPPYVIHRDKNNFSPLPDEFWPDRWLPVGQRNPSTKVKTLEGLSNPSTEQPNSDSVILDLSAFIPFSHGPANCVGKSLALLEMRAVISGIIRHFDLKFGDDGARKYDPGNWSRDIEDWFVMATGKLPVIFTSRQ